jgi:hypothetical protein
VAESTEGRVIVPWPNLDPLLLGLGTVPMCNLSTRRQMTSILSTINCFCKRTCDVPITDNQYLHNYYTIIIHENTLKTSVIDTTGILSGILDFVYDVCVTLLQFRVPFTILSRCVLKYHPIVTNISYNHFYC